MAIYKSAFGGKNIYTIALCGLKLSDLQSRFSTTMADSYKLIFKNATDQAWHFGVYQKIPTSPGLTNIAWQVRGVPPKKSDIPSTAQVNWTMSYGLCIADFDEDQRTFTGSQMAPALLGNKYKVESLDGIPSIDTTPIATGSSDQITLKNATSPVTPLTMGFTLGGNILCVERDVGGMEETIYRVHPTYYVACYHNIVLGQMVDEGVVIGPVEVKYDSGIRQMTVEATKDPAGNYRINVSPN